MTEFAIKPPHDVEKLPIYSYRIDYTHVSLQFWLTTLPFGLGIAMQWYNLSYSLVHEKLETPAIHERQAIDSENIKRDKVIFIVPAKGRVETFLRFAKLWAAIAENDDKIGLFVSIFGSDIEMK